MPPAPERPRYARVLSPGEDSNSYDLALAVVFRAMFLCVFLTQVIFAGSELWRTIAIVASVLWLFPLIDAVRRWRASLSDS